MSRNKTILLLLLLVGIYFFLPNSPTGIYIKAVTVRLLPYVAIVLIAYLAVTLHLLRKALNGLIMDISDENVALVVKRLRMSFDVKRSMGVGTLKNIYNQVNRSKKVTTKSKEDLYEAIKRKRVDIPLPTRGNVAS